MKINIALMRINLPLMKIKFYKSGNQFCTDENLSILQKK